MGQLHSNVVVLRVFIPFSLHSGQSTARRRVQTLQLHRLSPIPSSTFSYVCRLLHRRPSHDRKLRVLSRKHWFSACRSASFTSLSSDERDRFPPGVVPCTRTLPREQAHKQGNYLCGFSLHNGIIDHTSHTYWRSLRLRTYGRRTVECRDLVLLSPTCGRLCPTRH